MYIEFMGARAYVCVRASPDCRDAAGRRQTHQMEAMTKSLIIAEKPSVAQDIVRALTPNRSASSTSTTSTSRTTSTSSPRPSATSLEIKAPEEYDVKRGKWSFAHLPVIPPHFDLNPIDKSKAGSTPSSSSPSART